MVTIGDDGRDRKSQMIAVPQPNANADADAAIIITSIDDVCNYPAMAATNCDDLASMAYW